MTKRSIVIVLIIMSALLGYVLFSVIVNIRQIETPAPPPAGQEEKIPRVSPAIPENRLPSVAEIEEAIKKEETLNKTQEAREAKKKERRAVPEQAVEKSKEGAIGPAQEHATLRKREEVKFPTHEERKKAESQTGVVAY